MTLLREDEMPLALIDLIKKRTVFDETGTGAVVSDLFRWSDTPEGDDFWVDVDSWQENDDRDHNYLPEPFNVLRNQFLLHLTEVVS